MPRSSSTTLIARGVSARAALSSLWEELEQLIPEHTAPGLVVTVQARAEQDGSGFVATAALWTLPKYTESRD